MDEQRTLAGWVGVLRSGVFLVAFSLGYSASILAQVSISSGGTPSFSQGIEVPPGVAGMAPKLGILYAGGGVNGPLGHGWSIQGISTITRCAPTIATDGKRGAVKYDAQDKLCLDGQRLIQVTAPGNASAAAAPTQTNDSAGTPVSSPREYRTEKDSYTRIRAYGDINGAPAYFLVWNKSGQVYEYGLGPSTAAETKEENTALITTQKTVSGVTSTVTMAWAVARIRDTLGNAIDFKYEQRYVSWGSGVDAAKPGVATQGKEWNLLEVQYARNKVIFNYDPADSRQDKSEAYHQGYKNVSARLLQSIVTYSGTTSTALGPQGTAVKTVKLEYDEGPVTKRKRLTALQVCAGGASSTRCTPKTTFAYSAGGNQAYTASTNFGNGGSNLPTTQLISGGGIDLGIVVGDFNGDGRTDFMRWADDPTQNQLFLSNGDGSFAASSNFNLKQAGQNLFHSNACYYSLIADINADGLPDIFRYADTSNTDCTTLQPPLSQTVLFLNKGNGAFEAVTYIGPELIRQKRAWGGSENGWGPGSNFYLLDLNGDGIPDILTAQSEVLENRIYFGNGKGSFVEPTPLRQVATEPLYTDPLSVADITSHVADVNGDGYLDLIGMNLNSASVYISNGNGTFRPMTPGESLADSGKCGIALDFNGDGRKDCLFASPDSAYPSKLMLSDGVDNIRSVTGFNVVGAGNELARYTNKQHPWLGVVVADFDSDGKDDILRWHEDPAANILLLSAGNGSFSQSSSFNLKNASDGLQHSNGLTGFYLGDFTGQGNTEILRLKTGPTGNDNQNVLYVKTVATPPDQLVSVTSGTGLRTDLSYAALSSTAANGRYTSDRGDPANAAIYPTVDLTLPLQVVTTMRADTGVGTGVVISNYAYAGLKADINGRGILGFREVRRESPGPNGDPLTVRTTYLQQHPYIGVASRTETRNATFNNLGAPLLSRTVNLYCDTSVSGVTPTEAAPCAVSAKIQRPYLFQVTEEGWDLGGIALPKVVTTNLFNPAGDPTRITVVTSGTSAGILQTSTKVVDNFYQPDQTSGDDWILGRLTKATATNTVQDLRASLVPGFGTAANANAVVGIGGSGGTTPTIPTLVLTGCVNSGSTMTPTKATYTCILGNTGSTSAATVTYNTSIANTTVSGPTSCAANMANCGNVVVSSSTTVGVYSGTVVAKPNSGTSATSASFTLAVVAATPANLTLTNCVNSGARTTPNAATYSCTLGNTAAAAASSVIYSVASGATAAGPTSCAANTANCGTVVVTSSTAPGTYSGSLLAIPGNGGSTPSASYSLTVNKVSTTPSLVIAPGTPAVGVPITYTVTVAGSSPTGTVNFFVGGSFIGAATIASSKAVFTQSAGLAAGSYSASATYAGDANNNISTSVNTGFTVIPKPTVTITRDRNPLIAGQNTTTTWATTNATSLSFNCTAAGTGFVGSQTQPSVNGSSVDVARAAWVSFPSTCVWTATGAGGSTTFTETITTVNPPPAALSLSSCVNSGARTTPNAATYSCTLGNTAAAAASSVTYSVAPGATAAGPTSCAANTANCGTVVVTSSTAPGTYSGSLLAIPGNGGSTPSASYSLTVNKAASSTAFTFSPSNPVAAGVPYTLRATVSGANPTGTVNFLVGGTLFVSAPVVGGVATFTQPPGATAGSYPLSASYLGDANNNPSTSSVTTVTVTAPVNATVTVSPTSLAFGSRRADSGYLLVLTLTNTSSIAATGLARTIITTSGGTSGDFYDNLTGTCGATLAPNSSCTVSVAFETYCRIGSAGGSAVISGSNFSSLSVPLSGSTMGRCSDFR